MIKASRFLVNKSPHRTAKSRAADIFLPTVRDLYFSILFFLFYVDAYSHSIRRDTPSASPISAIRNRMEVPP